MFADVDPSTGNLDPVALVGRVTPTTRAVIPVHYAGRPVDVRSLRAIAARHGLVVIEDAAHCIEGIGGRPQDWDDRRFHLLQLLRDQEPDDRRGRHGDDGLG